MTTITPPVVHSQSQETYNFRDLAGEQQPRHELHDVIAVAAYYLAERREFAPGHEVQDWLAAERQIGGNGINLA